MYQPEAYSAALAFMLGSMICWGSWANTMKLTEGWPFQLFYWDYVLGMVVATFLWGVTFGSLGSRGLPFFADLGQSDLRHVLYALGGGAIFNVANLLLVAAVEMAGLAVAFPVGIGLALVVGVVLNYLLRPSGNLFFLVIGVGLVLFAIFFDAVAYRFREVEHKRASRPGIQLSILCGILMGLFYPFVEKATEGPRGFGPYAVAFVFSLGVVLCSLPVNGALMRRPITGAPPVSMHAYTVAPWKWHFWAVLGGGIWASGAVLNFVASHATIVGPAVSYAIGQGATMVSAIWGVFVWREFRNAPPISRQLIPIALFLFAAGLFFVAVAPVYR